MVNVAMRPIVLFFSALTHAVDSFLGNFTLPGLPRMALFNNVAYLCRIAIRHDVPL